MAVKNGEEATSPTPLWSMVLISWLFFSTLVVLKQGLHVAQAGPAALSSCLFLPSARTGDRPPQLLAIQQGLEFGQSLKYVKYLLQLTFLQLLWLQLNFIQWQKIKQNRNMLSHLGDWDCSSGTAMLCMAPGTVLTGVTRDRRNGKHTNQVGWWLLWWRSQSIPESRHVYIYWAGGGLLHTAEHGGSFTLG